MTTSPPQSPKKRDTSLVADATDNLKLVWRLMLDRRVNFFAKLLPVAAVIYFVMPTDFMVGPIDDVLIVWAGTQLFIGICPPEVVYKHRLAIAREQQVRDGIVPPNPPPTQPAAARSSPSTQPPIPTQPSPTRTNPPPPPPAQPAIAPAALEAGEVTQKYTVVIRRHEGNSIFHLTPRTSEAIKANIDLKKSINRYKVQWDTDTFQVSTKREAQVIASLLQYLPGLRVQSPT